jgi:hypothetical protein
MVSAMTQNKALRTASGPASDTAGASRGCEGPDTRDTPCLEGPPVAGRQCPAAAAAAAAAGRAGQYAGTSWHGSHIPPVPDPGGDRRAWVVAGKLASRPINTINFILARFEWQRPCGSSRFRRQNGRSGLEVRPPRPPALPPRTQGVRGCDLDRKGVKPGGRRLRTAGDRCEGGAGGSVAWPRSWRHDAPWLPVGAQPAAAAGEKRRAAWV